MNTLYLASKSPSRKYLLREAQIPFVVLEQSADEAACDWSQDLEVVVLSIAQHKMRHVIMPHAQEGQQIWVLTADTLAQNSEGRILGKPVNEQEAISTLESLKPAVRVATAFCIHRKRYENSHWCVEACQEGVVVSQVQCEIPSQWIKRYFASSPIGFQATGGLAVEGYGMQFVRSIEGSYSGVIGLPLFEVRQALEILGFFSDQ